MRRQNSFSGRRRVLRPAKTRKTATVGSAVKYFILFLLVWSLHAVASDARLTLSAQNIPPEFTALYEIRKSSLKVGEMHVTLEKTPANDWHYRSATIPQGIAAVFLDDQAITDHARLQQVEDSIRPISFEHIQKTRNKDRSQYIAFDWTRKTAATQYKETAREIAVPENTFDNFSLQLLLMANVHSLPDEMRLPVISKGKFKQYDFYKIGTEVIKTVYGERQTILVERRKDNEKKSTYRFWADPNHYGLPLQFEKVENGKRKYIARIMETSFIAN